MSRSGYSDDIDNWALIRWRGAVASALRGRHGQAFLREALGVLDAMEDKRLAAGTFVEGGYCLLGAVGAARGLDMAAIDPEEPDRELLAHLFHIAPAMAAEIMYENDECVIWHSPPNALRWSRMRDWVKRHIKAEA
jgi:hypothetical protein